MRALTRILTPALVGGAILLAGSGSGQAQICFEGIGNARCDRLGATVREGRRSFRGMQERQERMERLNRVRGRRIQEQESRNGTVHVQERRAPR